MNIEQDADDEQEYGPSPSAFSFELLSCTQALSGGSIVVIVRLISAISLLALLSFWSRQELHPDNCRRTNAWSSGIDISLLMAKGFVPRAAVSVYLRDADNVRLPTATNFHWRYRVYISTIRLHSITTIIITNQQLCFIWRTGLSHCHKCWCYCHLRSVWMNHTSFSKDNDLTIGSIMHAVTFKQPGVADWPCKGRLRKLNFVKYQCDTNLRSKFHTVPLLYNSTCDFYCDWTFTASHTGIAWTIII